MMKSDSISKKSSSVAGYLVLVGIILLASFLRFYRLGDESFWVDEIGHILAVESTSFRTVIENIRIHAGAAPLDYGILLLINQVFDLKTELSFRIPYAVYGVLSVYLIYILTKRNLGSNVGLLSAFFLAISPFHIRYSQEVRFYSLSVLLSILSFLIFDKALKRRTTRFWIYWGIVNIFAFYTFYYFGFLLLGQLLFLIWRLLEEFESKKFRSLIKNDDFMKVMFISLITMLAFLPWIIWDHSSHSQGFGFDTTFTIFEAFERISNAAGGYFTLPVFLLIVVPTLSDDIYSVLGFKFQVQHYLVRKTPFQVF